MGPFPEPRPHSLNFQLLKLGAEHTYFVHEVTLPQVFHYCDEKQNLCGAELTAIISLLAAEFPLARTLRRSVTSSLRNPPPEIVFTLPSFLNAFHPSGTYYSRCSILCRCLKIFHCLLTLWVLVRILPSLYHLPVEWNMLVFTHAVLKISLCLISRTLITIMLRNDFLCANLVWGCLGSLIPKIKSFLKFGEF